MATSEGINVLQRMRKNQKRIRKEMQKLHAQKEQILSSSRVSYVPRKRARTALLTPENVNKMRGKAKGRHVNVSFLSPPEIIPPSPIHPTPPPPPPASEHTPNPPRKKHLRAKSSTPKVNDSLLKFNGQCLQESTIGPDITIESVAGVNADKRSDEESQETASSTSALVDPSLEEAVFSAPRKSCNGGSRKQGLSVSFVNNDLPGKSSASKSRQGTHLVHSLRSTQYGGLERSLKVTQNTRKLLDYSALDPNLGYDWIAGALDSEDAGGSVLEAPDEYFDMIKEFRRVNKDLCTRPKPLSPVNAVAKTGRKCLSSQSGCGHQESATCTTSYVLNDRLFPVPVHEFEEGTHCPVCEGSNTEDGVKEPPRFVRVSVPRASLQAPHRWKSRYSSRRQSFDSVQSMGLLHHCQAGWESARPVVVPTQETVDLSSSLIQAPLGSQRVTKDLLNTSYSTQYHSLTRSPVQ